MLHGFGTKSLFKLTKPIVPVAKRGENREDDIAKLETALERSGDMDLRPTDGPTGFYGQRLKNGIERFQERNGLKVDGVVNPGGETIRTLAALSGRALPRKEPRGPGVGMRRQLPERPTGRNSNIEAPEAFRAEIRRRLEERGIEKPGELVKRFDPDALRQIVEISGAPVRRRKVVDTDELTSLLLGLLSSDPDSEDLTINGPMIGGIRN